MLCPQVARELEAAGALAETSEYMPA